MAGFRITDCTARRAPGRIIRRIDKMMRALIGERLASFGVNYPQWSTLKMVREGLVGTAGDLGRELGYTSGATTRLIDTLEARGWLARIRDAGDRRVVRLAVTPAGDHLVESALQPVLDLWNEMVVDFTQDEADLFVEMLLRLQAAIAAKAGERTLAECAA